MLDDEALDGGPSIAIQIKGGKKPSLKLDQHAYDAYHESEELLAMVEKRQEE